MFPALKYGRESLIHEWAVGGIPILKEEVNAACFPLAKALRFWVTRTLGDCPNAMLKPATKKAISVKVFFKIEKY